MLLVLNRTYSSPFCRAHMAQLRQDYQQFVTRDVEVVVVGPEDAKAFSANWQKESLPFIGLPDPKTGVLKLYGQEVNFLHENLTGRVPTPGSFTARESGPPKRDNQHYSSGGPELADLIARMKDQKGFRAVEVVVVDSGSTDASAEMAEALGATLVRIAPEEFSHSHARNLGAERASGDYVLFTVQDALPPSERWLLEMFSALQRHAAAAVSCGEEQRPDSDLFYRAISWNHDRFMSASGRDAVLFHWEDETPMERRRSAQISDTACLIRRDLFLRRRWRRGSGLGRRRRCLGFLLRAWMSLMR